VEPLGERDPRRIGPYSLAGRLGAGGMGAVYLGRSPAGRLVAVKVVHEHLARDREFRERFSREVSAASRVNGLYTAQVVDADADAEVPWMATRYIAGSTLQALVRDRGPLPAPDVYALAAGVAEALGSIHAAGLVHRDLKPSNVVISDEGPQVIDFGVAQALDATALTGSGTLVGTVAYMAPEQMQEHSTVPAGDVWALGGLLYYAATGNPPFGLGNPAHVMHRVLTAKPDLSAVGHRGLSRLIGQCLSKDPADRPSPDRIIAVAAPLAAVREPIRHGTPLPVGSPIRPAAGTPSGLFTPSGPVTPASPDPNATTSSIALRPTARDRLVAGAPDTVGTARTGAPSRRAVLIGAGATAGLALVPAAFWLRSAQSSPSGGRAASSAKPVVGTGPAAADGTPGPTVAAEADVPGVTVLTGPAVAVLDARFSPDGGSLLVAGADGVAHLIDAASGRRRRLFGTRGDAAARCAAFSPDGTRIAVGLASGVADLWAIGPGTVQPVPGERRGDITAVAFSPDGRLLAEAGLDGAVVIHEVAPLRGVRTISVGAEVHDVAFAPDGRTLAGADAQGRVTLWNVATGAVVRQLTGHGGDVRSLAWSPKGRWLASGGKDGTLRTWDTDTGRQVGAVTVVAGGGDVSAVAYSPDGASLATASSDAVVRVFDASGGAARRSLTGHAGPVRSVAFGPDGKRLASAGDDGAVRLWDPGSGRPVLTASDVFAPVSDVAIAPDGSAVAIAALDAVRVLPLTPAGRPDGTARVLTTGGVDATAVRWADPDTLAIGRGSGLIELASVQAQTVLRSLPTNATPLCVAYSAKAKRVAAGDWTGRFWVWDATTGKQTHSFPVDVNSGSVRAMAFTPDGGILALGSDDAKVDLFEFRTGATIRVLTGHTQAVVRIAYSPDGVLLASAAMDGTVMIWNTRTYGLEFTLKGHGSAIRGMAISPDGRTLATGSEDRNVTLWDLRTGKVTRTLSGHADAVIAVDIAPGGRTVASASRDGTVRLWDLDTYPGGVS
jgi:WD40 repeat protein/serine/threonine protein kinase